VKITSGFDLIELFLMQEDNIYPSKSPTPAPKICGCKGENAEQCEVLEYLWQGCCRAPYSWQEDCPNLIEHKRVAHTPQKQKFVKSEVPRAVKEGNRRERRIRAKQEWVRSRLKVYDTHAAHVMLGLDDVLGMDEFVALADRLFDDFCHGGFTT
jgi:hypothetical protein